MRTMHELNEFLDCFVSPEKQEAARKRLETLLERSYDDGFQDSLNENGYRSHIW